MSFNHLVPKRRLLLGVPLLVVTLVAGVAQIAYTVPNLRASNSTAATYDGQETPSTAKDTAKVEEAKQAEAKAKEAEKKAKAEAEAKAATQTAAAKTASSATAAAANNLIFSDEFNGAAGSAPDASKWRIYGGKAPSRWGLECFVNDREHIALDGQGHLVQTATYNPEGVPCTNGSGLYKSGGMDTGAATGGLFNYKYGRAEARIKVPCASGSGLWPAWWSTGPSWPKGGEVDFLEIMNNASTGYNAKQSLHGPTTSGGAWNLPGSNVASSLWCNDYHTYGSIWEPGKISFTIDGKVTRVVTPANLPAGGTWPFDSNNHRLILDLQVGDHGGTVDNATLPQSMLVDYVRVYQ